MKNASRTIILMVLGFCLFLASCKDSDTTVVGNWRKYNDFSGPTRSGAFQFSIGNKTYVGLGIGGVNNAQYLQDCWVYDLDTRHWDSVAVFPGIGRELSVAFSLNGKGYVGTGYNRNLAPVEERYFKDFWEYDPATNAWTQLNNFAGERRFNALAFVYQGTAFVGTGTNGTYFNNFFKYEPGTDTWTKTADFPAKRQGAMTMTISDRVYVFGGESNGITASDFWEYTPEGTDPWTSRAQLSTNANYNDFITGVRRANGAAFTLDDLGYVVCGAVSGTPVNIVYQYNPVTDIWTRMSSFEGASRFQTVFWVLSDGDAFRAFVGTGSSGTQKYDDIWEWQPTVTYDPTAN